MFEQIRNGLAKEGRDDGRRCFVGTQTMSIGGTHDRGLEQSVMVVNSLESFHDESDKTQVIHRGLTWGMKQDARVCSK